MIAHNDNTKIETRVSSVNGFVKVSAYDFNNAVDWVYHARASLQSCRHWEVAAEADTLRNACAKLAVMVPKRAAAELEARRAKALAAAEETLVNNARRAVSRH